MKKFSHNYKLADLKPQPKEEDDEEMSDENIEQEEEELKEDKVATSTEFRHWKVHAKATKNVLDLLCEVFALASSYDKDDDFEEVDEVQMEEEVKDEKVIDLE